MVSCKFVNYNEYEFEVIRFVAPIGDQFYFMELQNTDDDWSDNHVLITWNVYQGIIDSLEDDAIYSIDEHSITGKRPMETYHLAMTALKELEDYLKTKYVYDEWITISHRIEAGWSDEKRHNVYEKVLLKHGWKVGISDNGACLVKYVNN